MALSPAYIIGLAIAVYVVASVLPGAILALFGANRTGWDTPTSALWALIPMLVVVVVLMKVYQGK